MAMRTRDQCPVVEHEGLHREQTFHATVYESQAPRSRGDGDVGSEVKVRVPRERGCRVLLDGGAAVKGFAARETSNERRVILHVIAIVGRYS